MKRKNRKWGIRLLLMCHLSPKLCQSLLIRPLDPDQTMPFHINNGNDVAGKNALDEYLWNEMKEE